VWNGRIVSNAPSDFLEAPIEGKFYERLTALVSRFEELETAISDPAIQKDRAHFQELLKEHGSAGARVGLFRTYLKILSGLEEAKSIIEEGDDPEIQELAAAEIDDLNEALREAARMVRSTILDQQVEGGDDCIIEIRAGIGGDEAALFAADIFKMYSLFSEQSRWKVEVLDERATDLGGYKEITFAVRGRGAFSRLCFESGGHRVQRVPTTESQGRIHTSAITVAVLQEAKETEMVVEESDLRIDTFCASGPGGQKVNKTASAVRITHVPTGIVVSIQDEKSQHRNRDKAMRVLRSRIKERQEQEKRQKEDALRRTLIGSGDRSDRIRTYNFPQNRVTDHRIGCTLYNLDRFVQGDLDELLRQLEAHDREERVQAL